VSATTAAHSAVRAESLRDYLEARRLLNGPQRTRGLDLLRGLIVKAPDYARAQATLARTLTTNLRAGTARNEELEEASSVAARAVDLDPDLAETHMALAILACHAADWSHCMEEFRRALTLDDSDTECRDTYAYWLAALGYVDQALREAETAWRSDPLSYNANFSYARLLDTAGRHNEAAQLLDALSAETGGLIYAKWHNAVWRHDYAAASKLTAAIPRSDGFREAYTVVTEALSEPRLWPQTLPLISTSERANGGINVQRIMMPNPDYGIVITGLEKMLRDGWPSYYMLLWMPEYVAMRRDPAFQDFLKRTGLLQYWRANGWPELCRADGDGARCD
jgi:tetratricopeptide (TPR) repeat protein